MVKVEFLQYDMRQLCSACVDKYLKRSKTTEKVLQKKALTPYVADDENDYDATKEPKGELQPIVAKVVMNMLYGARMARYDLLHSCQLWACKMIKRTKRYDQRLLPIVSYFHQILELTVFGWVGEDSKD